MCPTALQTATGMVAAAVVPARLDLSDDTRTWSQLEGLFLSYFRPRLMTAGKLALRGVQMDSHPLSMADVSEFLNLAPGLPAGPIVWDQGLGAKPSGWAPIVIYNPDRAALNLLVCIEWRVRFDIGNPAVSSHVHHGVTDDHSWDNQIRRATAVLPGVIDIVERVANTGFGLYRGAQLAGLM
jgi:hypothetical protein